MLQSAEGEVTQADCSAGLQHPGSLHHGSRNRTQVLSWTGAGNLFRSLGWVVQEAEPLPSCHHTCSWVPQDTSQLRAQSLSRAEQQTQVLRMRWLGGRLRGKDVGVLVGQLEAKAVPAEGRAAGRSRWTWSTGAETAGMCGEAGIKGTGTWQMAEREKRRAQAHSADPRQRRRVSRTEQMGRRELQVRGGVQ